MLCAFRRLCHVNIAGSTEVVNYDVNRKGESIGAHLRVTARLHLYFS